MTAPWVLGFERGDASFHFVGVASGNCLLIEDHAEPITLQPGDLLVMRDCSNFVLTTCPDLQPIDTFGPRRGLNGARANVVRLGGGGEQAEIVWGAGRVDDPIAQRLIQLLPPVIGCGARPNPYCDKIMQLLKVAFGGLDDVQDGGGAMSVAIADTLVFEAIRYWITRDQKVQDSLLQMVKDHRISDAIRLMQRQPERDWSVALLARSVGMSRSVFAERFTEIIGEPAMKYLLKWRMNLAVSMLNCQEENIGVIAHRLGYSSEASFSRAFRRVIGIPPSSARRSPENPHG